MGEIFTGVDKAHLNLRMIKEIAFYRTACW